MLTHRPALHILCGKTASGKSTLAKRVSAKTGTVLVVEDEWLAALFADELTSVDDYVRCSTKLKEIMGAHVKALLAAGLTVVLDFPANTPGQRRWFKNIIDKSGASHTLHFLDVSDEVCLAALRTRNTAGDHPFTVTDAQFHEITRYFSAPSEEEGFTIVRYGAEDRDVDWAQRP